ncbi:MAG TPA: D-glucuronyl C5-epimerase family protein [Solirubrobacteraceae bacterium]|nr:D-glucuronyl C5-epimerase family protein [Solirubrobacteraceae bacterium]
MRARHLRSLCSGAPTRRSLVGLAVCLAALMVSGPAPAATRAPAPAAKKASSTQLARASRGQSVSGALQSLRAGGGITSAQYSQYYNAYVAAKRSLGRLSGTRRSELGAVLANVQAMAASGYFIPSRLPVIFLTLERNRRWWTTEPLLSSGTRVSFPGSKIVWQYYPGQGIEIQWLGTFGSANGYYLSGHENSNLRQLVSEVLPLATKRAGGIAWEYMFQFDGGRPPWTSGLSQGTALQVLARSWSRFKEPALLSAAQQALGVFQTAPSSGVQVKTSAGAHYAEYTYAPSDRILNGFIQAVVGLYDYTQITKDPLGLKLFEAGDAEARVETPRYDTGAWSLYDQYSESNLNYHELLTEFLQHLCERTRKGPPMSTAPPPPPPSTQTTTTTPPPTTTSTTPTTTTPTTPAGGTAATGTTASAARASTAAGATRGRAAATSTNPSATQIAGDQIYCTTAQKFTTYLKTPPVVSLITKTLKGGTRAGVQLSLSKVSTVRLKVRRNGRTVWTNSAYVSRGRPKLLWSTPAAGGTFSVTLTATDPAGNFSTATGTIVVSRR